MRHHPDRREERAAQGLTDVGLGDRIHHKPNETFRRSTSTVAIARGSSMDRRLFWPTNRRESDSKTVKKSWSCLRIYITTATPIISRDHERDIAAHARRTVPFGDGLIEMDHVGLFQTRPAGCEIFRHERFLYELSESWKIAAAQMRSNLTRSPHGTRSYYRLIAVTLMGTAVNGISIGFDKSMAVLGDDVLYVTNGRGSQWTTVETMRSEKIKTEYAETLNRMIAATPNSNLVVAVPTSN